MGGNQSRKQPVNLWWLSITYALFMCAFASTLASLSLYLTDGLHIPLKQAYSIYAVFASLMWTLPLAGGYLAGKFGYKQAAGVGLFFCLLGAVSLTDNNLLLTYVGIAAFVVGNALFTPALWCLVDCSYSKQDPRREAGFTLFYLVFNIGAVFAIFAGGFIATHINYSVMFALDAVFLALAAVIYFAKVSRLTFDRTRKIEPQVNWKNSSITIFLYSLCLAALPIVTLLYKHFTWTTDVLYALSISAVLIILKIAFQQKEKIAKFKVIGFLSLTLVSLAFWVLYNLEPSMMSVFVSHNVVRHLLGMDVPAQSFLGFEAGSIVIIGLLLSRMWLYLSFKGKDPALSYKFAFGLLLIGLSFIYLYKVILVDGLNHTMPIQLVLVAYVLFAAAELLISPIGIAMVGRLSPNGQEGLFMGVWQLFQGLAAILGGYVAKYSIVSQPSDLAASNSSYAHLFFIVGLVTVAIGTCALGLAPAIKKFL